MSRSRGSVGRRGVTNAVERVTKINVEAGVATRVGVKVARPVACVAFQHSVIPISGLSTRMCSHPCRKAIFPGVLREE